MVCLTSRLKAAEEEKAEQDTVLYDVRTELNETKDRLQIAKSHVVILNQRMQQENMKYWNRETTILASWSTLEMSWNALS